MIFNPLTSGKVWDGPQHSWEFCQSHRLSSGISEGMPGKKTILIHHIPLCNSTDSETGADCSPTVKPDQTLLRLWARSECCWILSSSGEISVRARASLLLWCRKRRKQAERKEEKGLFSGVQLRAKKLSLVGGSPFPLIAGYLQHPQALKKVYVRAGGGRRGSWCLTRVQYC